MHMNLVLVPAVTRVDRSGSIISHSCGCSVYMKKEEEEWDLAALAESMKLATAGTSENNDLQAIEDADITTS